MKRTILILTAICLLLSLTGCGEKTIVSYYRHLDLSGIHNIKLKYPVEPDSSDLRKLYKVARDKSGRITILKFPEIRGGIDPQDEYAYIKISYDPGREIWRYYDRDKKPIMTMDGIYGEEYKLDKNGFPVSVTYIDSLDKPVESAICVVTRLLSTNGKGLVSECLRLNLKGDTITDYKGNYQTRYIYNDDGFVIEEANYNDEGILAVCTDSIAVIRRAFNENGDQIEESYFGADNQPRPHDEDYTATLKYTYDDIGNLIEIQALGISGELVSRWALETCIKKVKRHPNGYVSEITLLSADQVIRKIIKYNTYGQRTEEKSFGPNGLLIMDPCLKYAVYTASYNGLGFILDENFYDDQMRLIVNENCGFARVVYELDDNNYRTKKSYFNPENKLFENPLYLYAFSTYQYDIRKRTITETYRDIRGFPKKCNNGYAAKTSFYDKDWVLTDSKFFDESGNLITTPKFDKDEEMIQ